MKILTPENKCYEMNSLPENEIEDIRYFVMDVTCIIIIKILSLLVLCILYVMYPYPDIR